MTYHLHKVINLTWGLFSSRYPRVALTRNINNICSYIDPSNSLQWDVGVRGGSNIYRYFDNYFPLKP